MRTLINGLYPPVYVQYEWLKDYEIRTVIDVGAYHGKVSQVLNYIFPKASIYAFEPIIENCKIIRSNISSEKLVIENIALNNREGKATFYKNKFLPASSLLPVEKNYSKKYKLISKSKKTIVSTTTLDKYFENKKIKDSVFLKIDTQGAEGAILEGGLNFLKKVAIVHVETSFDELYKEQDLFKDIYSRLINLGFSYAGESKEAEFYPSFKPRARVNSIFINPSKIEMWKIS